MGWLFRAKKEEINKKQKETGRGNRKRATSVEDVVGGRVRGLETPQD